MSQVMVIGIGSELRGDDALGPLAARRVGELLSDAGADPGGWNRRAWAASGGRAWVVTCQGLTPDLAADIAGASLVVFIDCAAAGRVGEVIERRVAPADTNEMSMVHFLDPSALLAWTRALYGRCPCAVLLTVPGLRFDIAQELSPAVAAALEEVVERTMRLIGATCHA